MCVFTCLSLPLFHFHSFPLYKQLSNINFFNFRYGIRPENIILYGQNIGTVPTVDLATRYEVGAVILHSPLMLGMRVAFPNTKRL